MTTDDDLHRRLAAIVDAVQGIEPSVAEAVEYGRSAQRRVREWGFLGIARNMENILNAFAELEQRRRSVSDDLAECLGGATPVDGSEPPEQTVARLTALADQLGRASSSTRSAAEQAAITVRIVGAVLVGGKPEPLQHRAGGMGDAFRSVSAALETVCAEVRREIETARQAGGAELGAAADGDVTRPHPTEFVIERYRDRLDAEIPAPGGGSGGRFRRKTHGIGVSRGGVEYELRSGEQDRYYDQVNRHAREIGSEIGLPSNAKLARASDAELKYAMWMREQNVREASLTINNTPCVGPLGCDSLLPHFLPPGSVLHVYGARGFRKTYYGKSDDESAG